MKLVVVLEKIESNWAAYTPHDGLCVNACADTREATISLFVDALRFHLDGMREAGQPFPEITALEIHETLPLPASLAAA